MGETEMSDKKWYIKNREKVIAKSRAWRESNKERYEAWHKEYRKLNRRQKKDYDLRRLYDITIDIYEYIEEHQGGLCAVCRKPGKRLFVDHCHKTNKVRGLLCSACNFAAGNLEDDLGRILRLHDYIKAHK